MTTVPIVRVPFHFSYLLYVSGISDRVARAYFTTGLKIRRLTKTGPTLLLHPLDFLGADDIPELAFFLGMDLDASTKIDRLGRFVDGLSAEFKIDPVLRYAESIAATSPQVRLLQP